MTTRTCGGSYIDVGPLEQTLFLGCSVTNFNMSLGWGADSSSLTVGLVQDKSYHPKSPRLQALKSLVTSVNASPINPPNPSTALEVNPQTELVSSESASTKYLHRTISQDIAEQYKETDNPNTDNGKTYWTLNGSKQSWVNPDPGFVGSGYNIIGTPAYFKFADGVEFGGMIAGWKASNNNGGGGVEVEIKSYTSLLAGCQLIIDNYIGSISTIINDSIAVPSLTEGDYSGSVKHGNIPNVFNVYGYLESYGFGTAGKTSNGVSALQIYKALIDLTSGTNTNQYSPYGAIVGKHVVKTDGSEVNVSSETITVAGSSITLEQLGLCRNIQAIDSIKRSLFKLDLTEVPIPPNDLYIGGTAYVSLLDFITRICDGAGYDFYVAFQKDTSGSTSGIIKIKTVSRRTQPKTDVIKTIVTNLLASATDNRVQSTLYGQEHNNNDKTRSMYIGAPQKRLLQVLSTNIALNQNSLVFDPYANNGQGSFMSYGTFSNYIRIPDHGSTRVNQYNSDGGSAVGQINTSNDFNNSDTLGNSLSISQGNYFLSESVTTQDTVTTQNPLLRDNNSYPLYLDLICPYFGNHGSATSNGSSAFPRKVFLDKKMGQLQVVFNTNDITTIVSNPYQSNVEFIATETELRAAGKSFEAWFTYCFDNFFTPDISDLVYTIFRKNYPSLTKNSFIHGLRIINWSAIVKTPATQAHDFRGSPVTIENAQPYVKFLYDDLQKIHSFFQSVVQEYYGKQYMVRTPKLKWYKDGDIKISFGNFAYPNSGKVHTDWEISKDGAWEEPGNYIDDTIIVGSTVSDFFTSDDGRILPILGFNACGELSTRDFWATTNLSPSVSSAYKLTAIGLSKTKAQGVKDDFFYFPLEHNFNVDEYIYMPYVSPAKINGGLGNTDSTLLNLQTSHGEAIPDKWLYKMYVKSNVSEDIIFLDNQPRAVVSLPSPLFIGGGKSDTDDALDMNMLHDAICYNEKGTTFPKGYTGSRRTNTTLSTFSLLFRWGFTSVFRLYAPDNNVAINSSSENVKILPKATCPAFAAIPVQFNRATYGPWINHPGLVGHNIFPGYENVDNFVNNLVGGVNLDIDDGLVPWDYGGMDALDIAVMSRIKDDINYQQTTEQGTITIAGLLKDPNGNAVALGDALSVSAGALGGPILSNLSISIDSNGILSTYNLRTYSKKIGFFNKENSERIKAINLEFLKRRRDVNKNITNALSSVKANGFTSTQNIDTGETPKPLRWSPFEILAGASYIHLNEKSSITDIYKPNSLNYSPYWHKLPYGNAGSVTTKDMPRYLTNVSLQDVQELPRELKDDYALKSFMSLDGLLSPISFYPTPYGSTYSITKYPRSGCPFCKGTATYTWEKFDLPYNPKNFSLLSLVNAKTTVSEICRFCELETEKTKKSYISASPKETTPPYVLASGDDLTIISRNNISALSGISGNPVINYSTLNPILLSTGEFGCVQNRQSDDRTAHSIDLVGFGMTAPTGDNSLKPSRSNAIEKNFLDYDQNHIDYCNANGISLPTNPFANNMRFFGLRGPIMVHGWGYDLEGYPVPNASGEPKVVNNVIVTDSNGNIIGKNQTQKPDKSWTKPYKENAFYKGWGQLPGTWPVGPIDLRWDSRAGVWTVGANYKPVWILIETDLVKGDPSRGEIIEDDSSSNDSYSNDPLPSGLRKLVFVKDSLGINPAPRGAPVYCKYNSENGFYEPIYHKVFTSSGIIRGDTTVDIYNLYKDIDQTYSTTYKNPLSFDVTYDGLGLFSYMNDSWVLQSYKC